MTDVTIHLSASRPASRPALLMAALLVLLVLLAVQQRARPPTGSRPIAWPDKKAGCSGQGGPATEQAETSFSFPHVAGRTALIQAARTQPLRDIGLSCQLSFCTQLPSSSFS